MSILMQGILLDGTIIAVKQLSPKSKQGNREFVNEIGMISALQHPNVVRLYGCCVEGNQLFLVYEYMENNSLARALFGKLNVFILVFYVDFYLSKKKNYVDFRKHKNLAPQMVSISRTKSTKSPLDYLLNMQVQRNTA